MCGSAEVEEVLCLSKRTKFSCTLIFFFFVFFFRLFVSFFVHVAQLSIALGRHTLPHVRV